MWGHAGLAEQLSEGFGFWPLRLWTAHSWRFMHRADPILHGTMSYSGAQPGEGLLIRWKEKELHAVVNGMSFLLALKLLAWCLWPWCFIAVFHLDLILRNSALFSSRYQSHDFPICIGSIIKLLLNVFCSSASRFFAFCFVSLFSCSFVLSFFSFYPLPFSLSHPVSLFHPYLSFLPFSSLLILSPFFIHFSR